MPTEDEYNSLVSVYAHSVFNIPVRHHPDEECWMAIVEHSDPSVETVNEDIVFNLLKKIAEAGFKSRYWFSPIKDQYEHVLGKSMMFVYNN